MTAHSYASATGKDICGQMDKVLLLFFIFNEKLMINEVINIIQTQSLQAEGL